jgi:hypothetical protein
MSNFTAWNFSQSGARNASSGLSVTAGFCRRGSIRKIILESAAFAFHMSWTTSGIIWGIASRVFLSR